MEREITVLVAVTVRTFGPALGHTDWEPGQASDAEVADQLVRELGIKDDTGGIFYPATGHTVERVDRPTLHVSEPWCIVSAKLA
jgi:hypothetical protein